MIVPYTMPLIRTALPGLTSPARFIGRPTTSASRTRKSRSFTPAAESGRVTSIVSYFLQSPVMGGRTVASGFSGFAALQISTSDLNDMLEKWILRRRAAGVERSKPL